MNDCGEGRPLTWRNEKRGRGYGISTLRKGRMLIRSGHYNAMCATESLQSVYPDTPKARTRKA